LKVCVVGAGAIGAFMGVQLAQADCEVSLVARGQHLDAMRDRGLRLQIDGTERTARLPCSDRPADFGIQDYVIVAVKAHDVDAVAEAMLPLLGPDTVLVTATNGLPYWYFYGDVPFEGTTLESTDPGGRQWRLFGPARAVGCVVFPAAEVVEPGVVRHEHGRRFPIGEPDGAITPRLERLHDAMEAGGLEAPMRNDIRDEIWLKLCGNVCFNPISALTQATIDVVAGEPATQAICRTMMEEARRVGERIGTRMRVDVETRINGAAALGPHKMSMLQDLERGKTMEVEPIVGVMQELGRLTHVPTPVTDIVLALIRQRAATASSTLH